jgi:hypothetical protein
MRRIYIPFSLGFSFLCTGTKVKDASLALLLKCHQLLRHQLLSDFHLRTGRF